MNKEDLQEFIGKTVLIVKKDNWRNRGIITKISEDSLFLQTDNDLRVISLDQIFEVKQSINNQK